MSININFNFGGAGGCCGQNPYQGGMSPFGMQPGMGAFGPQGGMGPFGPQQQQMGAMMMMMQGMMMTFMAQMMQAMGAGGFPMAGGMPGFGGMPGMGGMPGIGGMPGMGGMPNFGGMPGFGGFGGGGFPSMGGGFPSMGGGGGGGYPALGGAGSTGGMIPTGPVGPGVQGALDKARSMLGMHESTNRGQIQSVTGKSGINPSTTPWCAAFAMNILKDAGVLDLKGLSNRNYCPTIVNWAKEKGIFGPRGNYQPKPGDAIMFDWQGDGKSDHIGIVEKVENGKVITIEGNSSNRVKRNSYSLGSRNIMGYVIGGKPHR